MKWEIWVFSSFFLRWSSLLISLSLHFPYDISPFHELIRFSVFVCNSYNCAICIPSTNIIYNINCNIYQIWMTFNECNFCVKLRMFCTRLIAYAINCWIEVIAIEGAKNNTVACFSLPRFFSSCYLAFSSKSPTRYKQIQITPKHDHQKTQRLVRVRVWARSLRIFIIT